MNERKISLKDFKFLFCKYIDNHEWEVISKAMNYKKNFNDKFYNKKTTLDCFCCLPSLVE